AATPAGQYMLAQQALGFLGCTWAIRAPNVTIEKFFDDAVDAVGFGCAGRYFLSAWVAPFGNGAQRLARKNSGCLQVDSRVAAESMLAGNALVPIAYRPRSRAARLRLHDEIQTRHVIVGDLTPIGARAHSLDGLDGQSHGRSLPSPRVTFG